MTTPPIIGLTLNYRDADRTANCVCSLLADGAQAVLVWDNSEDDSASLSALRATFAGDPRVHLVLSPLNLGFAAGVNRGLEWIAKHYPDSWVMLLNNDATLRPGALLALSDVLQSKRQAVIAYPSVSHAGKNIGTFYYQRHFALLSFKRPLPGSFAYPSGSALLIAPQRDVTPLFDEDFFMYGEDVLLGWRLGKARMAYVPQILVDHEGSATSKNESAFYEQSLVVGHWLLGRKLARNRVDCVLLLGCRIISLSARALLRALRSRSFTPIQALYKIWFLSR